MNENIAFKIRQVQNADYEILARFFEENSRPEITRYFHPFPLTAETAHQIACVVHRDLYYIAVQEKEILGMCMLRGWDEGFDVPSFGIMVYRKFQGLGLGHRLVEFAISEARRLGCPSIRLSVYASNMHAIGIFTSFGFTEVTREPCLVGDVPEEKIIMLKKLQ